MSVIKDSVKRLARKFGYQIGKIPPPPSPVPPLTPLEAQFIKFMSIKKNQPYHQTEEIYLQTKEKIRFDQPGYFDLCEKVHYLFRILHDDLDEKNLLESYQFYALPHIFYFINDWNPKMEQTAARLLQILGPKRPVVVDYGAGLAHISFEIAKLSESKTFLVDIENLKLEFARFRFGQLGKPVEEILVSTDNLYPSLPAHNLCIATEVMEHLKEPLRAYQNIYDSLEKGGILYGDFRDHDPILFHISPDLKTLRQRIERDFDKIDAMSYRKK